MAGRLEHHGRRASTARSAGAPPPRAYPAFADGLRAALITEAVLASAGSGSWVEVSAADRG
jgi:hypothetical protein